MKTVILAGGRGTRLGVQSQNLPKPLVPVAGKPVLRHVMEIYARQGFKDFIVALGYRGLDIKRHFVESMWLDRDLVLDLANRSIKPETGPVDDWKVQLVDTGTDTATGSRIARLADRIGKSRFMLTWCDGLADIDLDALLAFHRRHGKVATLTAVNHKARFGYLTLDGDSVSRFEEKPLREEDWINGAFFVLERKIFDYIDQDNCDWETAVLQRLVDDEQLMAYRHHGSWQAMDTPSDRDALEQAIDAGLLGFSNNGGVK